jgi:hypothetical protein
MRFDLVREFRPAIKTVFARNHELRVGECEPGAATSMFPHSRQCLRRTGLQGSEEVFGLFLVLLEVRMCR